MSKPRHTSGPAKRPESMKPPAKTNVATPATQPAPVPQAERPPPPQICVDELRVRAFLKWEAAGKPDGDGVQYWLAAEHELLQGSRI